MSAQPSGDARASGVGEPDPARSGIGGGLMRGLVTTAKTLLHPSHTAEYPDVLPALPPRTRGVIALVQENCTVCMLCARECPDWCIYIDSHKETIPAVGGGRERQRNVLDRFAIDFSLCMYCGICVEVCPFDALLWSSEFEYAEFNLNDLLHEKERLSQWAATVPPPPAADPAAPAPKEVQAAAKAAEKARAALQAAQEAQAQAQAEEQAGAEAQADAQAQAVAEAEAAGASGQLPPAEGTS